MKIKETKKYYYLFILCLVMLLCIIPKEVNASSTDDQTYKYTIEGYKLTIERSSKQNFNIIIPSRSSDDYCYSWEESTDIKSTLEELVIGSKIESIGMSAFEGYKELKKITIGEDVTVIEANAFKDCSKLTEITIPKNVTRIDDRSFDGCTSLKKINVDANNKSYSSKDGILYIKNGNGWDLKKCPEGKENVTFSENTYGIKQGAFTNCSKLTEINIPQTVTSINLSAFDGCTSLKEINVDENNNSFSSKDGILYRKNGNGWDLIKCPEGKESVTFSENTYGISSGAFTNCSKLTIINIPQTVSSISFSAFDGCTSLKKINVVIVDINNAYYSSKDGILYSKGGTALYRCPEGSENENMDLSGITQIYTNAFLNCKKLKGTIKLLDKYKDKWTTTYAPGCTVNIDWISNNSGGDQNQEFQNGDYNNGKIYAKLENGKLTIKPGSNATENDIITISKDSKNYPWTAYKDDITEIVIESKDNINIYKIGDYAFENFSNLTKVQINSDIQIIGNGAFMECKKLSEINLPDSVTQIFNSAFRDCSSLKTINIPVNISYISYYAFQNCTSLTGKIEIPSSVSVAEKAFEGCNNVEIVRPSTSDKIEYELSDNNNTLYIKKITKKSEYEWKDSDGNKIDSTKITKIRIGENIESIPENLFRKCKNLERIEVDSNNSNYSSDDNGILYNKSKSMLIKLPLKVTTITIPSTVTSIDSNAFDDCYDLAEIKVADGNEAFYVNKGILYNWYFKESVLIRKIIKCPQKLSGVIKIDKDVKEVDEKAFYQRSDELKIKCYAELYDEINKLQYNVTKEKLYDIKYIYGNNEELQQSFVDGQSLKTIDFEELLKEDAYKDKYFRCWRVFKDGNYVNNVEYSNGQKNAYFILNENDITNDITLKAVFENNQIEYELTPPSKLEYYYGANLNLNGAKLQVKTNNTDLDFVELRNNSNIEIKGFESKPDFNGKQEVEQTVEVYYNGNKVGEFKVKIKSNIKSEIKIGDKTYVIFQGNKAKSENILPQLSDGCEIYDKDNNTVAGETLIKTGQIIKDGDTTKTVILTGDINSDGELGFTDVIQLNNIRLRKDDINNKLTEEQRIALKVLVNNNLEDSNLGQISFFDIIKLNNCRLCQL